MGVPPCSERLSGELGGHLFMFEHMFEHVKIELLPEQTVQIAQRGQAAADTIDQ
jgi:hypothetical protein